MEGWISCAVCDRKVFCISMKIIKYFFVGGVAAAVDIGLFAIFAKWLGYHYLVVGTTSFVVATLVNYLLSIRHVFESGVRFSKHHEIVLIYVVSAVGLGVNLLALYICIDGIEMELMMSKIVANGVVFFWNYLARRNYIFRVV